MVNVNKPITMMIMKKAKIEALVIFRDTVWREFLKEQSNVCNGSVHKYYIYRVRCIHIYTYIFTIMVYRMK